MHWELWDVDTANQLAAFETESEAVMFVRELLTQGWKAADLVLILDDPALPFEDLPPATTDYELARRAEAAGTGPIRRRA